ncbi:hypothetical protein [Amycolatopsis sp. NPDC003861]
MLDGIVWVLGPDDQAQPIEFNDHDGRMLISWRAGQPPTLGMFQLLNRLTNEHGERSWGRIEWASGPEGQARAIEVEDRDGHMLIHWRNGQPPTSGMIELLNRFTAEVADGREEPPRAC